jgi:hypothetical protein
MLCNRFLGTKATLRYKGSHPQINTDCTDFFGGLYFGVIS